MGTGAGRGIQLKWGAVANATEYTIYRASTSAGRYREVGKTSTTEWLDNSGLLPLMPYYYKVVASTGLEKSVVVSTLW